MIAVLIAIFLGTWGLPSSLAPQIANIEYSAYDQGPPTQDEADASPHPSPVAESSGDERQNKDRNKSGETNPFLAWCERWQTPINLATAVLIAIFTGLLTLYTVKLWTSGEKHSERELRAYVFPISVKVTNFRTPTPLLAAVQIRNSGQTPAYRLTCTTRLVICPFPNTDFSVPKNFNVEYLGPTTKMWRTARTKEALTREQEQQILNGNFSIHVFGRIDYTDAFGSPRWTTFRTITRAENGGMLTEPDKPDTLIMSFDKEGNEAT